MAILTGVIRFIGGLGGIRHFKKLHDPNIYASEKGGVPKSIYKKSPRFKNNRLSNVEFGGCARAVKGIRGGLYQVIPEMVDGSFTDRLMKFARNLTLQDKEGLIGQRSLRFSTVRPSMKSLSFDKQHRAIYYAMHSLRSTHSEPRTDITLSVNGLNIKMMDSPSGATHYRILSHASIVSDYCYSKMMKRYDPINPADGLRAFAYSDLARLGDDFTTQINISFPEGTVLGDDCSVLHCVAIEFIQPNGGSNFRPIYGASMKMMDVF